MVVVLAALSLAGAGEPAAPPLVERPPLPVIDRLPADHPHGGKLRETSAIDLIVIHTIGGPGCVDGAIVYGAAKGTAVFWRDWLDRQPDKSIHYVVDRDGAIAAQRPDERTAGHVAFNGVVPRVNDRSIGIELVNRGDGVEPFPEAQIASLIALVQDLASKYGLPASDLRTHASLDTRVQVCGGVEHPRNVDPNVLFPIDRVRAALPAVVP
jgi:N-acetylmuramoyl-L-alanine amidase